MVYSSIYFTSGAGRRPCTVVYSIITSPWEPDGGRVQWFIPVSLHHGSRTEAVYSGLFQYHFTSRVGQRPCTVVYSIITSPEESDGGRAQWFLLVYTSPVESDRGRVQWFILVYTSPVKPDGGRVQWFILVYTSPVEPDGGRVQWFILVYTSPVKPDGGRVQWFILVYTSPVEPDGGRVQWFILVYTSPVEPDGGRVQWFILVYSSPVKPDGGRVQWFIPVSLHQWSRTEAVYSGLFQYYFTSGAGRRPCTVVYSSITSPVEPDGGRVQWFIPVSLHHGSRTEAVYSGLFQYHFTNEAGRRPCTLVYSSITSPWEPDGGRVQWFIPVSIHHGSRTEAVYSGLFQYHFTMGASVNVKKHSFFSVNKDQGNLDAYLTIAFLLPHSFLQQHIWVMDIFK